MDEKVSNHNFRVCTVFLGSYGQQRGKAGRGMVETRRLTTFSSPPSLIASVIDTYVISKKKKKKKQKKNKIPLGEKRGFFYFFLASSLYYIEPCRGFPGIVGGR